MREIPLNVQEKMLNYFYEINLKKYIEQSNATVQGERKTFKKAIKEYHKTKKYKTFRKECI